MISELNEIEAKLDARLVLPKQFSKYVMEHWEVENYRRIVSPDFYWKSGDSVLRHRMKQNGNHELTVKKRTSTASTRDRLEIDLPFDERTEPDHVEAFLRAIGYTQEFVLQKSAHIFTIRRTASLNIEMVIYDVMLRDKPGTNRRFIEIEAKKGSPISVERAKRHVNEAVAEMCDEFDLPPPLNQSLYEIYSAENRAASL